MNRRDILLAAATSAASGVVGRAWATPQSDQKLLVLFLRGGYDAANVVIPTSSDFYYQARPSLQIARPNPADPGAALPLDADWSLHPALKDTILPLWNDGQIAFVPFAGPSDDLSRSHFETQDTIEMGQPVQSVRDYGSGFMGRLASQIEGVDFISFTAQPSLAFHGRKLVPNIDLARTSKPGVDDRQAKLIQDMYRGHALSTAVAEGFTVRDMAYRATTTEEVMANRSAASPRGFELAARRIARLMSERYTLAFMDVGGWDTHVGQGAAKGYLADRIGELGRGLAGFREEMDDRTWRKTTIIVVSEFGRTFRENGDKGTDHGHGSTYWVLGGSVRGGRIVGEQVKVNAATLNQDRDLPVLTDYRALIGGVIQRTYGFKTDRLLSVFPQTRALDLQLT